MSALLGALVLGAALLAVGAMQEARAQAPAPPPIEGNVYSVTYVEVQPTSRAAAVALLAPYRALTRQEDGNLRCEVLGRLGQAHQLVILEVWRDLTAFEAHGRSPRTVETRRKLEAIRIAPLDERVHRGLSVGPPGPAPAGDAVYVVTHVDVVPPRKEDGVAALTDLADAGRASPGNARFEVVQQASRPNHFTVVEIWKDATALQAHSMAEATRRFRDRLAPISGALYDERMYRAVE
jgi:quinol monooxygenase YgiN